MINIAIKISSIKPKIPKIDSGKISKGDNKYMNKKIQ